MTTNTHSSGQTLQRHTHLVRTLPYNLDQRFKRLSILFFRRRSSFTDSDLLSVIEACQANDPQAQRTLFRQFYSYAKSVCMRYMANADEADDVLNESFLKVFQHLSSYDTTLPFKAWLRTIVVNTAISYHRKYHKLDTVTSQSSLTGTMPDIPVPDTVIDQISADDILALVQQLPPVQRTVFVMHVVDGYSLREVADTLNANEATIRSHFLRARIRLQELVGTAFSTKHHPSKYYEN